MKDVNYILQHLDYYTCMILSQLKEAQNDSIKFGITYMLESKLDLLELSINHLRSTDRQIPDYLQRFIDDEAITKEEAEILADEYFNVEASFTDKIKRG